ncbi:NAD(P)-dependent dehydrogenase (short-subunit alcohol dehydrogenase family) [Catenulispora sp. MAP12-49]|uniref:SDR family NAD(P)-dependent oxidoreductase n=1 Tax=Catenulispora sp. MAP12-49 TaxID=3156302 RepID=UPI003511F271
MQDEQTRTVLVTGAGGGVGRATTQALAERGFRVYAAVREPGGEVPRHPDVRTLRLDVTDPAGIADAAALVRSDGCTALHGIVNNAGIIVQGPLELVSPHDLRHQFDVNVFGAVAVTQAFLPLLRTGHGRLVNITAATARVAGPFFGPISASKAALQSLSDAQRLELAHWGLPVVVIEPGLIDTTIFSKAAAATAKAKAALSPAQLALYEAQVDAVDAAFAKSKPAAPEIVADAVVKALTARKPQPRYTVGPDTRLLGLLARLPLRTRDRLLAGVMGLNKIPAAR